MSEFEGGVVQHPARKPAGQFAQRLPGDMASAQAASGKSGCDLRPIRLRGFLRERRCRKPSLALFKEVPYSSCGKLHHTADKGDFRSHFADSAELTAIGDAPWLHRRADKIPADRDTRGSTAHSGSRASTAGPPQCPRVAPIGTRVPSERPRPGNRSALDWGTMPAPPFGIRVAGGPTSAGVIQPSCLPVTMALAFPDERAFVVVLAGSCV
jgi:hypothetical protein